MYFVFMALPPYSPSGQNLKVIVFWLLVVVTPARSLETV